MFFRCLCMTLCLGLPANAQDVVVTLDRSISMDEITAPIPDCRDDNCTVSKAAQSQYLLAQALVKAAEPLCGADSQLSIIGWGKNSYELLPWQSVATREQSLEVSETVKQLPVSLTRESNLQPALDQALAALAARASSVGVILTIRDDTFLTDAPLTSLAWRTSYVEAAGYRYYEFSMTEDESLLELSERLQGIFDEIRSSPHFCIG